MHQLVAGMIMLLGLALQPAVARAGSCSPTPADQLGPYYQPNAPERSAVGTGYLLTGTVRSTADCAPVAGAVVEVWLAGPDGGYGDAWRAAVRPDASGVYRFESHVPPPYFGRPPHIHIRVSAPGFRTLATQHYPRKGAVAAVFDLVVVPER